MVVCNSSHLLFSCYGFGLYCEWRKLSIVMQNLRVISLFKLWERFYLLSFINYRTDWTVLLWIYYEWMRTLRSVGQAQETVTQLVMRHTVCVDPHPLDHCMTLAVVAARAPAPAINRYRAAANQLHECTSLQHTGYWSTGQTDGHSTVILCVSKKQDTKLLPISFPNVNRFSKFFHWQTHW